MCVARGKKGWGLLERFEVGEEILQVLLPHLPPGHRPVQGLSSGVDPLRDGAPDEGVGVGEMRHLPRPFCLLLAGCRRSSLNELTTLTLEADKTLVF